MSQLIRAFVAHSFWENDQALVNTFCEYFDKIKDMGIGFSWDHAKAAEAKELAEKVLGLVQDKNVFIGICTNHERAINADELKPGRLKRGILRADQAKYSWKASDWIIQEIGLAVGRGMSLILLIEKGLRPPGGLQGNIEYIEFVRESPERCFGKILDMIRSLRPKAMTTAAAESTTQTSEDRAEQGQNEDEDWFLHPKPTWSAFMYRIALNKAIAADNAEGQEVITSAYLESPEGREAHNREAWESFEEYLRLLLGKGGTLDRMLELAVSHPHNAEVQAYLGGAYEAYKEYEKAAASYRLASENATNTDNAVANLGEAALSLLRAGNNTESEVVVNEMRQRLGRDGQGEVTMIERLREIADLKADNDMYFGLTEYMLALKPDDVDTRFNLAYKYSQENEDNLSFFHYLRIPKNRRHLNAWNNLGVEYEHFNLDASSVDAYREAEKLGSTLAMCNLALRLIGAGFLPEAQEICNRILKMDDYDKGVHRHILSIKERPAEEEKKQDELVKKTQAYSEFYKGYGKALTLAEPADYVGLWQGPQCPLRIEIKDGNFVAVGRYKLRAALTTAGLAQIYAGLVSQTPEEPRIYLVRYVGKITGYSVKASVGVEEEGSQSGRRLGGSFLTEPTRKDALLVIADSFAEIHVYEKDAPEDHRFYTLRPVQNASLSAT